MSPTVESIPSRWGHRRQDVSAVPHFVWLKQLAQAGISPPTAEYRFAPPRRWRFDWCWPEKLVALEVEGGVWTKGRHLRGKGYLGDMQKYSEAAIMGWCVVRTTPDKLYSPETIEMLQRALKVRSVA